MLKKLKIKFVLVTMGIVLAMLAVIFGLVYHFTKTDLENTSYAELQRLAQLTTNPAGVRELPRDLQLPYFVMLVDPAGRIVAQGYTNHDLSDSDFLEDTVDAVWDAGVNQGVLQEEELLYRVMATGRSRYIVFVDISSYNATLTSLVQSSLLIGAASILVFLLLSIFLARWMVRPVEKMWQQQRQFVSDASHELKTPLTVIMSNAELLQSPEYDGEKKEIFTQSILTMSHQMRGLVEGLLELARADNGQSRKSFSRVDMSALVSESVLPFEPVLFERSIQLDCEVQPNVTVLGNPEQLKRVVDVLLDNAGKYAQPGTVNVRLTGSGKRCLLSVSNPGTPIPAEALEKVFERFYRVDDARSRTGSYGLGLPIARALVTDHGGKIWAQSNQTGNCFFVELPSE